MRRNWSGQLECQRDAHNTLQRQFSIISSLQKWFWGGLWVRSCKVDDNNWNRLFFYCQFKFHGLSGWKSVGLCPVLYWITPPFREDGGGCNSCCWPEDMKYSKYRCNMANYSGSYQAFLILNKPLNSAQLLLDLCHELTLAFWHSTNLYCHTNRLLTGQFCCTCKKYVNRIAKFRVLKNR